MIRGKASIGSEENCILRDAPAAIKALYSYSIEQQADKPYLKRLEGRRAYADKLCCKYTAKQKQMLSELNKKEIEM